MTDWAWAGLALIGVWVLGLLFLFALGRAATRGDERLAHMDFDRHTDDAIRLFTDQHWTALDDAQVRRVLENGDR